MIDSRRALETVVRHAVDIEDDYEDIAATINALAASGDATLVPQLDEALARFLDEGNFYGRDLIAAVLAGIQGVAALPALLSASARDLGDDQDGFRTEIIDLMHSGRVAARRTVLVFLGSDTPELRRVGLWALGFVAESADVELLATAATDRDPQVRSMAVGSIPDPAGDERAFNTVVRALSDLDEQVRVSAVSRLGYTKRADAVTPLASLASDQSTRVRSFVAYALGRLRRTEATPALLRLLHDPERRVREQATQSLGLVGGPAAVDALLALAAAQDSRLRAQAAKALAHAVDVDPRAAERVNVLAEDAEATVRAATLSGLASAVAGSTDWGPLVVKLAADPDPMVRQRVAVVVRRLAPRVAAAILDRYASDDDQNLRRIAMTELDRLTNSAGQ